MPVGCGIACKLPPYSGLQMNHGFLVKRSIVEIWNCNLVCLGDAVFKQGVMFHTDTGAGHEARVCICVAVISIGAGKCLWYYGIIYKSAGRPCPALLCRFQPV